MSIADPRAAAATLVLALALGACGAEVGDRVGGESGGSVGENAQTTPTFEVDPTWPLEMPDLWVMGSVTGVFVDDRDHVWVTHLTETLTPEETSAVEDPPIGSCCRPAPAVV
ncbi:MAG: hypothetical protein KJP18_16695, partial [Gemmatimonadetes bacterium]|nr:hypothetical protein [Gemmatimonadota bacterium]